MTQDDKKKCVELWEAASGLKTSPNMWCDESADILAEMFAEIKNCSRAFSYVPEPPGSRPGKYWLLGYAYQVIKNVYLTGDQTRSACQTLALNRFRTPLEISFMGCR